MATPVRQASRRSWFDLLTVASKWKVGTVYRHSRAQVHVRGRSAFLNKEQPFLVQELSPNVEEPLLAVDGRASYEVACGMPEVARGDCICTFLPR